MPAATLGLSILSSGTAYAIHSAINPSLFTLKAFAEDGKKKKMARAGLITGLLVGLGFAFGILLVFKSVLVAISAALTSLTLFYLGWKCVAPGAKGACP